MLPEDDVAFLEQQHPGYSVEVVAADNMTCVTLPHFQLPNGFTVSESTLLLRLNALYPDSVPDMWWFDPPIVRVSNLIIPATELIETHLDRQWQRWSRHLTPDQWNSGIDNLRSYVSLVRSELQRAAESP